MMFGVVFRVIVSNVEEISPFLAKKHFSHFLTKKRGLSPYPLGILVKISNLLKLSV